MTIGCWNATLVVKSVEVYSRVVTHAYFEVDCKLIKSWVLLLCLMFTPDLVDLQDAHKTYRKISGKFPKPSESCLPEQS